MELIKIHDKTFEPYVSAEELNQIAERMASEVYQDLQESRPIFIAILNGSFMFAADFLRHYKGECEISFVKMASYEGTQSTGKIHQLIGLSTPVEGRDVVILEDIIDTGNTLEEIYRIFEDKKVKSFRVATLFFKPDAYKKDLKIDYVGKPIPNRFIVGYGLDFDEIARNLPQVYQLNTSLTMTNLVLFGKPGAGKGTQAAFLKDKYNLVHISTGDVFRYNIKNETKLGKLAQSYMDKGDLVPDEVTIQMLQEEVEKNPNAEGFIFDGFPRTIAQAEALDAFLDSKGMRIHGTLALEADDEVLIKRLVERGKVSGRTDDQDEEKIRNRFTEYNEKTAPLIAFYQTQGKYHAINGIGTIEEITTRLSETIDKIKAE
ncbi:adenylate kinase [Capnocytophaga sp. oral taxon 903]|uniref:adenylate kinase n=1 Tax=Capnocytophaga sp. oral taxon 903 TaxID=2748317 RepID=UPI0015BC9BF8|nr:adenylate kinase [Capnocytophaga sp. oral taxon 903]NWO28768.1 adenylate kinase [Capnocytophaga sp. oral taxon 903]